ncbi:MAG: M1 family aminopeptidase, partial [SAR324 cluster bacterium]|nr:M1 family aminopeptidase [SAR324 cluster bacterium]
ATNWHPKLLSWEADKTFNGTSWSTSGNNPSPATFEVSWKAVQGGTLITTPGNYELLAGQKLSLPVSKIPLKEFPLIFSNLHQQLNGKNGVNISIEKSVLASAKKESQLVSFYFKSHERRAKLLHNWTVDFLKFMHTRFRLKSTWESIRIVEVEAEYEQIDVINNLVLVPSPNYRRSGLTDRQALGFLTRRLAQLWFGESVWSNEDTQQWLNLGLPAFFGLRFFQHKFGGDAGIFDTFDWMNPRYRDHYFESMVNSISPKLSYPILSSFRENPDSQKYLQTLTYKSAMVFSMLEYFLGDIAFQKGLQHFFKNNQQKLVGLKEIQKAFEKFNHPSLRTPLLPAESPYNAEGYGSLEWFFSQWFRTVQTLDYSFEDSTTRTLSNGKYETIIMVNKIGAGKMPLVVELRTIDGREIRKILPGIKLQETIQFVTESFPDKISLDPDEQLLETSRINNHSFKFFRVRFGFDWKKQREQLVLLVPGFGNNALDGNSFGVGIRYK